MQTFPVEQSIRTLVDEQLKNLGWNLNHRDKECNVYQEQPRTDEEKKKLKGKRPDYVLYSKDRHRKEPLIVIETKKPGENLDEALKQGDRYAEQLNAPIVFATDWVYYKTIYTKLKKPLYLNGEEIDELIRELEALKFLKEDTNELNTISKDVINSRKALIKIFEEANDLLRDEWLRAGIERFWEFANILFLKLLGEIEDLKEEEGKDFLISRDFRRSHWKNKTGDELLHFVNDSVLKEMWRVYKDYDIFTPLGIKNPTTLKKIIDKLEPLNLINIDSDIKGDSFEYFLKQSTATKNDLGEYFTPRHIVKTMVKLINPQFGEKIYDPFCGTGGMLIESFKHIYNNMPRNKETLKILRENTVFWNEITSTARITKMNMILIGDGHSGIKQINSLENPINWDVDGSGFDVVITNMPYAQKTKYGGLYDLPSTNGDSICIQHCIKAINKTSENGRMALIVPEGFLFRKDLQKTRKYLLDRCVLKSIISLPQGVFLPYTWVKTNILYCTNVKQKKKQDKFRYFSVKNDWYTLDNHRRKLEWESDLQKFLEYRNTEIQEQKDIMKIGFSQIKISDIIKNDYILVGSCYNKLVDHSSIQRKFIKIRDIADIVPWFAFKSSKFNTEKGIPLIRIRDLKRWYSETRYNGDYDKTYLVEKGDLLIGMDWDFSPVIRKWDQSLLNQRICKLHNFKSSTKEYIFYVIKRVLKHIEDTTPQTTVKHISIKQILDIEIPLPPISEQKKIVREIELMETKIYKNKEEIHELKVGIESKIDFIWGE